MQPILSQFILFLFDFNPYRVYLRYILHFVNSLSFPLTWDTMVVMVMMTMYCNIQAHTEGTM